MLDRTDGARSSYDPAADRVDRVAERSALEVAYDRGIGVICLAGIAVTHLTDLPEKIEEAPYMAVMFCGLIVGSAGLAILLARGHSSIMMWRLAGTIAALPLIGYLASRSVGLPQLEDHVGDWVNPAGVASLVFEAVLVGLSVTHLCQGRRRFEQTATAGRRI